jgi:hypothetical protein
MNDSSDDRAAAALERARVRDLDVPGGDLDALWGRVAAETVAAKPTLLGRLRELSTARRVGFVMLATIALAALMVALMGARPDLGGELVARWALILFALSVLSCAVFAVALRGVHQRPLGWVGWALVGVAVVVPYALALMPSLWSGHASEAATVVDGCGFIGAALGAFAAVLAWMVQRSTTPVVVRVLASAAGGGIVGFAMLQLHCPANDVEHLVVGHAVVGVALVAIAAVGLGVRHVLRPR